VCVLVYKSLHQAAPAYLAELCSPVSESANRGHRRSAVRGDLAVPRFRTMRYGQRCCAVSGPTLWNSLPLSVRDPSLLLPQFCACILQSIRNTSIVPTWQDCCVNINSLTYLLTYLLNVVLVGLYRHAVPKQWKPVNTVISV